MSDPLGDRMKGQYEFRARTYLPRLTADLGDILSDIIPAMPSFKES